VGVDVNRDVGVLVPDGGDEKPVKASE